MKNKILLGIVAAMTIMLLSMISLASAAGGAWSTNQFNNSLTTEALTFTGTGSFTRYLNINSSVGNVLNSQMTLAGTHVHVPYIVDCYQETANSATGGDGVCGLNYSGAAGYWTTGDIFDASYPATNIYDANWGTYAQSRTGFGADDAYLWANYTKPVNASSIKIKFKTVTYPGTTEVNYTYTAPDSCFNYYTDKVQFVFQSQTYQDPGYNYALYVYCRSGSGTYVQLYGNGGFSNANHIYEDGVFWTISNDQYPNNVTIKIGSDTIFSMIGIFNYTNTTSNFWQTVNNYAQPCLDAYHSNATNGTCQVPITFYNTLYNGTVTYSSLVFNNYNWQEIANIYNNITYETKPETFSLNFTYDDQWYTSNNVTFHYNGIDYTPTTVVQGNGYLASVSFDIPEILNASQINSLYWTVALTNSTGTRYFNSTFKNQTVYQMDFYHCNSSSPNKFITVRYKDETTDAYINASVITSSWSFNIVGSSLVKSLVYSSPGGNATDSDSFCFDPASLSIFVSTAEYQYGNAAAGYSTKSWPFRDLSLSNATTTEILYLINLVDSGTSPVTFQAVNSQTSTVVEGVRISAYRTINGIETLVDDGYTDASGILTFYMSPITAYKIVAYGGGCSSLTSTITPSGNQYNLLLSCGGGTGEQELVSQLDGITYARTPADGVNTPGTLLYSFNVNSAIYNLTRVRFEIVDAIDETILAYNDSLTNTATCTPSSCYLTFVYTTYTGDNIKGKYYVAINGTADGDLIMIEGDAYWRFIVINQNNSVNAIGRMMLNVQDFFNSWGTSTPNCLPYNTNTSCAAVPECKWVTYTEWAPKESQNYQQQGYLCVARDDLNKTEFNRIVTIFFFMVIFLFILGRTTGYELNHPGAFVVMMSIVIWALSLYGMFTFAGLTQYDFFNQYIFALSTSCIGMGYMISVIRRYSG